MIGFYWVGLISLFIYTLLIAYFTRGWLRLKNFTPNLDQKDSLGISVVIALRNEEKNIETLIQNLNSQLYCKELFEVILVDDHSSDKSYQLIDHAIKKLPNFTLLKLSEGLTGKKMALRTGINQAKNELLAFTDADCHPSSLWLKTLSQYYLEQQRPRLIIGAVDLSLKTGLFNKLQNLEFLSLIGTSLGSASVNQPIMCNGANLAMKRDSYNYYAIQPDIASGDDVFLLHSIKAEGTQHIKALKSTHSIIYTNPVEHLSDFFNQRNRWASKATAYSDNTSLLTALVVLTLNLCISVLLINTLITGFHKLFVVIILGKTLIDFMFFITILRFFKKQYLLLVFPLMIFIYPYYISYTALNGILKKPFHWKGRTFFI